MTMPQSLRSRWIDGGHTIGSWLSVREPLLAEVAAVSGYDYVCIDMQHGLMDADMMTHMVANITRTDSVPMVRVPWNDPGSIGRALDAGALAIVIPMVNTAEEAERAVSACRYAPAGSRSYGPLIPNNRFGSTYPRLANDHISVIPMIETAQAVDNLDEILSVPGVDAIYVGPTDLSLSLGLAPLMDHEGGPFDEALSTIVSACNRHGVVAGIHANPLLVAKRHAQGFRLLTVGYEIFAAIAALRGDGAAARKAIEHSQNLDNAAMNQAQ